MTTILGSLSRSNCGMTTNSNVYLILPIQTPALGTTIPPNYSPDIPPFNSSTQCLTPLCPAVPANLTGNIDIDQFLTPGSTPNTFTSYCNRVFSTSNFCLGTTCTCVAQLNGQTSFTGNACQFEKGAYCCSNQNH